MLNRINTLGDVEVGFLLSAVAQNSQFGWIVTELLDEIRNHIPALVWTDDIREPKHPDGEVI